MTTNTATTNTMTFTSPDEIFNVHTFVRGNLTLEITNNGIVTVRENDEVQFAGFVRAWWFDGQRFILKDSAWLRKCKKKNYKMACGATFREIEDFLNLFLAELMPF